MKNVIKGGLLGISLIFTNRLCHHFFDFFDTTKIFPYAFACIFLFFTVTTVFLISHKMTDLLICGAVGAGTAFCGEIMIMPFFGGNESVGLSILCYIAGFRGSLAAIGIASILTVKNSKKSHMETTDDKSFSKDLKLRLLLYFTVSAITFSYLIMPENAGLSVPVFTLIQLVILWFIVPDKKRLLVFIPIIIMSINCCISANNIWKVSNLLISIVLYGCMFMKYNFKKIGTNLLSNGFKQLIAPLNCFKIPFKWVAEFNSTKSAVIKRIVIAVVSAFACSVILIAVLSNADMVFSLKTQNLLSGILKTLNPHFIYVCVIGIIVGLYMFGVIHNSFDDNNICEKAKERNLKGDLIIINTVLFVVLFIYTVFVIIQYKYLFSGSALPAGLTYTEYARKGFFELLALSVVNIAAILTVIAFTKTHRDKWITLSKILCHYMCGVTLVLLASSFYKMLLYTNDDGLTRMRFFVMGFLIFEAIGLLITFVYIAKPHFNISVVYALIALTYYMFLNIVPADNIIAKNQIDKYLNNERKGIEYIFTLSSDAAPAMEYLYKNTDDIEIKKSVKAFLTDKTQSDIPDRWQRLNLSTEKAKNILTKLK